MLFPMKYKLCFILLFFSLFRLFPQNIISINGGEKQDKFVFDSLKNKLDNKRIICLGESEHMVETFSKCKTAFIKYLHDTLKYEVVAFEVGLLNVSNAYYNLASDTLAVKSSFYPIWQTESILDLYDYTLNQKKSGFPIVLAGFDIKSCNSTLGIEWVKSIFSKVNPTYSDLIFNTDTAAINACERVRKQFWNNRNKNSNFSVSIVLSQKQEKMFTDFYLSLSDSLKNRKDFFISNQLITELQYKIILHSVEDRIRNVQFFGINDFNNANNFRDSVMSKNIEWIANDLFKEKKIIFWAADAHISKKSVQHTGFSNVSSIEMLPTELKNQIETISLNFIERAPKKIRKQIMELKGNAFFVSHPDYLNGEFEDVIYFKQTEGIEKHMIN